MFKIGLKRSLKNLLRHQKSPMYDNYKMLIFKKNFSTINRNTKITNLQTLLLKTYRRPLRLNSKNSLIGIRQYSTGKKLSKFLQFVEDKWLKLKWVLIRSKRPFNMEDLSAFLSWILAGNLVLLLIGTTTFVSLLLFTMNTIMAQEMVAEWLGNLITKNSNLRVTFEHAIVPDWKGGKIQFKNCVVSKRPNNTYFFKKLKKNENNTEHDNEKCLNNNIVGNNEKNNEQNNEQNNNENNEEKFDDGNYTQFDLTINEINISLSFGKWIGGKGFINDASVKGIRGVVDRTHVFWIKGDDPTNYKNIYKPGDWEIDNVKIEDVLVTILHPNGFRPCQLSVYNCELPLFRKNWLVLDLLTCNHMSGCYDGSLFTINKISRIDNFKDEINIDKAVNDELGRKQFTEDLIDDEHFKKVTRCRIDNLKIEHLNKGMEGPFGWINKGTVDMIGDVLVLQNNESLNAVSIEEIFKCYNSKYNKENSKKVVDEENKIIEIDLSKLFIMDFYLRLKNPKAVIPLFPDELSYINSAAIRPIVGYINSRKTFIPIRCRVCKELADFDGAWTLYDSRLMDNLSASVYESFYEYASDEHMRTERLKKVGFWSLQFLIQFILWSLTTLNG